MSVIAVTFERGDHCRANTFNRFLTHLGFISLLHQRNITTELSRPEKRDALTPRSNPQTRLMKPAFQARLQRDARRTFSIGGPKV